LLDAGRSLDATSVRRVSGAFILTVLGLAQFINTYDTTAMNVAVSRVVKDLHTTVNGVQIALTTYALVMAAFMIAGGKLGDVWGRRRTFTLGITLYGSGALLTALSPNLGVMVIGWSVLEGLGSALMIPAIYALIPVTFPEGRERVKAFAVIGSLAGAGAASGPLICGFITTYLSWRISFAAEVAVVILVIILQSRMKTPSERLERQRFDVVGAILSAIGLGLLVMGILQANQLSTRGVLPIVYFCASGLFALGLFLAWQIFRKRTGKVELLDPAILRIRAIKLGLPLTATLNFMMAGGLFIIPVFQQMALGFEPVMSGLTFLPNTLSMIVISQLAGPLTMRYGRKWFIFAGLLSMSIGLSITAVLINSRSSAWIFIPGSLFIGAGVGSCMAPLMDLTQSSVPLEKQSEVSGVSRAFSNLGSSMGTAVAGAILIAVLIAGLGSLVTQSNVIPAAEKPAVEQAIKNDARTISNQQLAEILQSKGIGDPEAAELVNINAQARDRALKISLACIAGLGMLAGLLSLFLKNEGPRANA
jgi:EmrB/QacA subfamily drug resistance transporter